VLTLEGGGGRLDVPARDGDGAGVEGSGAPECAMHAALDGLAMFDVLAHLDDAAVRVVLHGDFTFSFVKFRR